MNILILGQGGREHALAWKIKQSNHCDQLIIAPGNGGTSSLGLNVPVNLSDFEAVVDIITSYNIELVVVGPEAPLAEGLTDFLADKLPGLKVVGPRQLGARLEASKAFAKEFMLRHHIPTARYKVVQADELEQGKQYLATMNTPIVLKADGLAAGKGVVICQSLSEAETTLETMLGGQFGAASQQVVIEEFLDGREYSIFALTDGTDYFLLPAAKDYKRIGEGDNGPNTGGMGAVSPVSYVNDELMKKTVESVIQPTIAGLQIDQIPYCGFVFFGLIEVSGEPFVIEYNCRMGDPETEAVLPRIKSDLVEHLLAACEGTITPSDMSITNEACAAVMLVSGGYPGSYEKDIEITGYQNNTDSLLFHAGTRLDDNMLKTNGGRVMAVSSISQDAQDAIKKSYETIKHIYFDKQYYRSDIGFDL